MRFLHEDPRMDPVHQTQGLMSHGASYRVARYFARRGHRQARHIGQPLTGLRSLLVSRYMLKCSCRETSCVSASFPCLNSPKMFRRCGNGGDLIPKKGNYYNIYIYMYVYIYICMYIYMYVYIYGHHTAAAAVLFVGWIPLKKGW